VGKLGIDSPQMLAELRDLHGERALQYLMANYSIQLHKKSGLFFTVLANFFTIKTCILLVPQDGEIQINYRKTTGKELITISLLPNPMAIVGVISSA
jgi:hypothetical protein